MMTDNKIKEYRTIHKKCKWCKYYKYHLYPHWLTIGYGECLLKDKYIKYESLPRICKYYEWKGNKNDSRTN